MQTLRLRADDEAALIDVLPMLRTIATILAGYAQPGGPVVPDQPILAEWDDDDGHWVARDESYEPVYVEREIWLTSGPVCDLDPIGPLALTAPVVDPETGEVVTPAVVDERFHANLRGPRIGADPDAWAAIVEAAAPITLTDIANPRRRFQS